MSTPKALSINRPYLLFSNPLDVQVSNLPPSPPITPPSNYIYFVPICILDTLFVPDLEVLTLSQKCHYQIWSKQMYSRLGMTGTCYVTGRCKSLHQSWDFPHKGKIRTPIE